MDLRPRLAQGQVRQISRQENSRVAVRAGKSQKQRAQYQLSPVSRSTRIARIDKFPNLPIIPSMKTDAISTAEAALILKCSERTVRNMIERGSLFNVRKLDADTKSVYILSRAEVTQKAQARYKRRSLANKR